LVAKPPILVFDDSSSALDFATEAALRRDLSRLPKDTTRVIVSQRAGTLLDADRILVLDDGRIVGLGTAEELLASCEVFREIYESQFGEKEAKA
jgi:ABC-type multidrug transport system fused ATPase/permease subunit